MQEIKIWPYEQVIYAQPKILTGEWDAKNSLGFWETCRSPNLNQSTRHRDSQQKKENLLNSELFHPGRSQSKIKSKQKEG